MERWGKMLASFLERFGTILRETITLKLRDFTKVTVQQSHHVSREGYPCSVQPFKDSPNMPSQYPWHWRWHLWVHHGSWQCSQDVFPTIPNVKSTYVHPPPSAFQNTHFRLWQSGWAALYHEASSRGDSADRCISRLQKKIETLEQGKIRKIQNICYREGMKKEQRLHVYIALPEWFSTCGLQPLCTAL